MRKIFVLLAFLCVVAGVSAAQGFGNDCTPAGTWYGGGDDYYVNGQLFHSPKYLMTIVPIRAGRFSFRGDEGFTPNPAAAKKLSEFSGELIKQPDGSYKGYALALANPSDVPPPLGGPDPNVAAVRETARMTACDTLEFEIDFNAIYAWGKIPFVDNPMVSRGPASETYHRMPTKCEVCSPPDE